VIVKVLARETVLGLRAGPYSVYAIFRATAGERAIVLSFVKADEKCRSSSCESAAVQNIRHETLEIIIPVLSTRASN